MQSSKLQPGDTAPDFQLPAVDGSQYHLATHLQQNHATVVMFICNHCPYVQAYISRLIALQNQFKGQAQLVAICSNDATDYPEDDFDHMKQASQKWGLNFPYMRDEDQAVAKAYGAERTPEIFVLDGKGVCRYEGGIDDHYQDASKVTDQPLRDAIAAVVGNHAVARPRTWAIGCTIKWKKS